MPEDKARHPLFALEEADLEFVLRFVLASGSLKEVATEYGVSYPTLRARLDRLIAQLQQLSDGRTMDPMAHLLADLLEQGELTLTAAKTIKDLHQKQLLQRKERD